MFYGTLWSAFLFQRLSEDLAQLFLGIWHSRGDCVLDEDKLLSLPFDQLRAGSAFPYEFSTHLRSEKTTTTTNRGAISNDNEFGCVVGFVFFSVLHYTPNATSVWEVFCFCF